jgi:cbb3-type cytochrome oxidase subunit 3
LVNVLAPVIVGIIIVLIIIGVVYWIYQQARTKA